MTEHEIFWTGRQPRGEHTAVPAAEPAFEAAVRRTCTTAGSAVQRYVAAQGPFGSWLVELTGRPARRLVWNGQAGRLSLDVRNGGGGWDERCAESPASADSDAVFAAIGRLLAED